MCNIVETVTAAVMSFVSSSQNVKRFILKETEGREFVFEGRTRCMGGSGRRDDFPSVVIVR